jgi:hypothetical protein
MRVLTGIGEQGISVGDRRVVLRPSLLNMTRIGDPKLIVETFVDVCGQPKLSGNYWVDEQQVKRWRRRQFDAAMHVLHCCAEEPLHDLIGHVNERGRYVRGALPMEDIVGLAYGLLKHGILGDAVADSRTASKKDYSNEFKARDIVAAAMAHLGASEDEAWNMTMTSYIAAMRAKFPPPADVKKPLTEEEYDHVSDWLARVNAARAGAAA